MKDQKMNKQEIKNVGVNPVIVATAGAVIGAGIAVAGAMLSQEKNREKVKKVATKLKNDAVENMENMKKQAETKKKELEKNISNDREKVRKVVSSAKNSLDKTTKEVNKAVKSL